MPKIISAFSGPDPIAETLSSLGKQLFGGDKTANAIKGEQLYALQRENREMDNLMGRIAAGGAQNLGADPTAQAILAGSGYSPEAFGKIGLLGAATGYGAKDPRTQNWQVGTGGSYAGTADAVDAKLAEDARGNTLASADRRYGTDSTAATERFKWGTPSATDMLKDSTDRFKWGNPSAEQTMQHEDRRYKEDMAAATERNKPFAVLDANGNPQLVPTGDATNGSYQPILTDTNRKGTLLGQNFDNLPALNPQQQEVLGARVSGDKAGTTRNYILPENGGVMLTYDSRTDVNGNPLPTGGYIGTVEGSAQDTGVTKPVRADEERATIANKKFQRLINMGMALTNDPTLFGAQGKVRSLAQELDAGVSGVTAALGGDVEAARNELAQELSATGVDATRVLPELYNPNLPKVQTIWGLLLYQGAAALAGQDGRSVSDADIKTFRSIIGEPQGWFTSAEMMRSKLETALEIVGSMDNVSREVLGGQAPVTENGADGTTTTTTGRKWRVVQ